MKVLITPRSFGQDSNICFEMMKEAGIEIVRNPFNRVMTEEELSSFVSDIDGIILGIDPLTKRVMVQAKNLKVISKYGVGINNIDTSYAKERKITIYKTVGANANAVADYAFGLMLALSRKIVHIHNECKKGNWNKIVTNEVWGKTIGIVGFGAIGKGVAKRASGFNMNILANDVVEDKAYAKANNIKFVDLETLIAQSDFISLHVPLMEETKDLFGYKAFKAMKDSAFLINTARDGIVDEAALYDALVTGKIAGAGVDVFEETCVKLDDFLALDNIIVGSHCAASSIEAISNMSLMSAKNLIDGLTLK